MGVAIYKNAQPVITVGKNIQQLPKLHNFQGYFSICYVSTKNLSIDSARW